MLQCLLREWKHAQARHGITKASTIFFGGGTPSLMPLELIETLVREIGGDVKVKTNISTEAENRSVTNSPVVFINRAIIPSVKFPK